MAAMIAFFMGIQSTRFCCFVWYTPKGMYVLLCSLCMHCVTYGIARLWLILVYLVWQHDPMDYVRRLILCVYRIAARNCFAENNHAIAEQIVNFCKKKNVLQKMKKRRDGKNQKSTFGIDIDTVIRSIKKSECLTKIRRRKIV